MDNKMDELELSQDIRAALLGADSPTLCNAIELIEGKRGFNGFTRETFLASDPQAKPILAYARTAKLAAKEPPKEDPSIIKERRIAYYEHMADGQGPRIAMIEDLDGPEAIGAWWGEINSNVHKGLGVHGVVTNGVMRDLDDLAEDFPIYAGKIVPSHGFVHVVDIACEVNIYGLRVKPGDLIHADRHGAVAIPNGYASLLPAAIDKMRQTEAIILEPSRAEGFDIETLKLAWAAFEKARI